MIIRQNYDAIYKYGSRVYGTFRDNSDYDYICIGKETKDTDYDNVSIHSYTLDDFKLQLVKANISSLECFFLPEEHVIKPLDEKLNYTLELNVLRHSISKASDQAFNKARKKFESPYLNDNLDIETQKEDERIRGMKSLFHSFRILDFGIQIAKYQKIIDYSSSNHIYNEIFESNYKDWNSYNQRWKKAHNVLSTEFRKLAPKE